MIFCVLAATAGSVWAEPATVQTTAEISITAPPVPAPESVSGRDRLPVSAGHPDTAFVPITVTRTPRVPRVESTGYAALIEQLVLPAAKPDDAMRQLVAAGKHALFALHAALLDEQATDMKRARIMQILGRIGDTSSVLPITRLAGHRHENRFLQKEALKALRQLPASGMARAYADSLLASLDTGPAIKRAALLYYAARPHPQARRWMIQYRSPGTDPSIRYAGLYLAAVMGDRSVLRWISALLEAGRPANEQYYLLLGLAELVPLNTFLAKVRDLDLAPGVREKVVQVARLRYARQSTTGPVVSFQDISPAGAAPDTGRLPLTTTDGQPARRWRWAGLGLAAFGLLGAVPWLYRRLGRRRCAGVR